MRTREFIVRLANGEFSKNDILQYAASVPDVVDLYKELWLSSMVVPKGYTKPIVEIGNNDVWEAIQILEDKYGNLTQQVKGNIQPKQAKPKRGRPVQPLADIMRVDNKGERLKKLHTLIDGKKGKEIALIIIACVKLGFMGKPTFQQLANEFGDIGSRQAYTNYSNES